MCIEFWGVWKEVIEPLERLFYGDSGVDLQLNDRHLRCMYVPILMFYSKLITKPS